MAKRNVRGDREAAKALRELGKALNGPAAAAARQALRPTLAEAKRNVPKDTGTLRRALVIRAGSKRSKTRTTTLVGPNKSVRGPDGKRSPVRYAHLVELGHLNRDGSKTPGARYLTRAFESTKDAVIDNFNRLFGVEVEKRAARLAAKVKR